jgi:drug/metabolite transporter (DMT)-like permease
MTLAYQNEKVGKIAIFTNIGIVYAIINGMFFFNEIPTAVAWIGIAVVVAGLLLNVGFIRFKNRGLGRI